MIKQYYPVLYAQELCANLSDTLDQLQQNKQVNFMVISGNADFVGPNEVLTDANGNAQARIKGWIENSLLIEAWYDDHTSSAIRVNVTNIAPVIDIPQFSFIENDIFLVFWKISVPEMVFFVIIIFVDILFLLFI